MTPETLKRLEELNDEWANNGLPITKAEEVMDHLPDLIQAVKERDIRTQERDACYEELTRVKAECDRLQGELVLHWEKTHDNYWGWQGDGEDHLESLICPVLIHAEALRTIIAELDAANAKCAEMRDALQLVHEPANGIFDSERGRFSKLCDHALSTDCGKDWVPKVELENVQMECAAMRDGLTALKDFLDSNRNDPDEIAALINAIRVPVCAEGYHHERDCEPLVGAVKWCYEHSGGYEAETCRQALAHWEKVKKVKEGKEGK